MKNKSDIDEIKPEYVQGWLFITKKWVKYLKLQLQIKSQNAKLCK
jgi:hypothetical protein